MSPRARGDALVLLGLAAAALLFWQSRVIAPGVEREGLFQIDFYTLMFPMYHYGFGELAQGRIPLWNPWTYCGIPFLATLYTGILYPGNFLFLLLPTGVALGMTAALHTFLAAAFMFLLARAWRWSRAASGAAAITFAFTQNAVWFYGPLCFVASAAWIPLMGLGIERACQGRGARGAALLALGGAMSLLAGGLQVFVYGAYALALFAAARLFRTGRILGARATVGAMLWLALGAATAAALAAPQILPSLALAERTARAPGALSLRWADNPILPALGVPPAAAPGVASPAVPASAGDAGEGRGTADALARLWSLRARETPAFYFGILPPLLAAAALFGGRPFIAGAILAGAILAAALSLGVRTPLYDLYHALPSGAWFRNPNRFALLTGLALAVLSGMGVTAVERARSALSRPFLAACAAAIVGGAILLATGTPAGTIARTLGVAAAGLALLRLAALPRSAPGRAWGGAALAVLLLGELALAYRNPFVHPQKDASALQAHAVVSRFLREHTGSERIAIVDQEWGSFSIQRKYGLLHRIRTLNDFEPLTPSVYARLFALLDGAPPEPLAPFDGRLRLDPRHSRKSLLDLLSVRYVVVDEGLYPVWDAAGPAFGLRRVRLDDPTVAVWENPGARPRATLVGGAVMVATEEEAAQVLGDPDFDPRRVAVVQSAGAAAILNASSALRGYTLAGWKAKAYGPARDVPGTARILRDEPGLVEIEARVAPKRASWLVLMDLDDPGWTATVDGWPATFVRANLLGRSVGLSAGTHRVTFTYDAPDFRLGCLVALLAACIWAFGALAARASSRGMGPGLLARRIVPWLVAVGILAFLVRHTGMENLRAAVAGADLRLLLLATVLCTLPMYLLDVLSLSRVVTWFNRPMGFREIAPVKAAVYLINIVNYNAGSGAVALWLKRRKGVAFLEGAASVLFINVVDAAVLVGFMAAGLPALSAPLDRGVAVLVACATLALAGHFLYWRGGFDFLLLGRLRGWPIFRSFRLAPFGRYLALAALRVPFDLLFILNFWLALRAFGIDVPFLKTLAFVPVILFIAVLPITVSGLGTVQAATVYLFAAYATDAKILAFSLVFTVAVNGVRALLGVPVFRRVSDDIFAAKGPGE